MNGAVLLKGRFAIETRVPQPIRRLPLRFPRTRDQGSIGSALDCASRGPPGAAYAVFGGQAHKPDPVRIPQWESNTERQLGALSERQVFFVGGAPRSGTTWLQQLLDSHPQISCRGEGLFWRTFGEPLDGVIARRRETLACQSASKFDPISASNVDPSWFCLGLVPVANRRDPRGAE